MAKQLPENLKDSIHKYLEGTANSDEKEQLNTWYRSFDDSNVEIPSNSTDIENQIDVRLKLRLKEMMGNDRETPVYLFRRTLLLRIAAAAIIIFIISTGTYFFLRKDNDVQVVKKTRTVKGDGVQFESKAVLTLQDGSKMSLTDAVKGETIKQEGFSITKIGEGQLVYKLLNSSGAGAARSASNIIQTPNGGDYQVKLPDGTRVWLNAASSLKLSTNFSDNDYVTDLSGEAYFEVTPNKSRKFRVRSGNQTVEVLGTHFNINAYGDEPSIHTTLLKGSVRITDLTSNQSKLLKPGQQADLSKTLQVSAVNAQDEIAWTEGYFHFNNADVKTVMRTLERWYGITVRYKGVLGQQKFAGLIDRKLTLQQVLGILEKSQVHFKVVGKEVIVMP